MKPAVLAIAACALVAACGPDRPAPGEAPGWEQPSPPRAAGTLPVPFRDQYLPATSHKIQQLPAVPDGHNVPYAVRGQGAAQAGAVPGGAPAPACITVPPAVFEGKPTTTLCPQPDGTWTFIPD